MNFKEFIEHIAPMELLSKTEVSKNLQYHLENKLSLSNNIFRVYSKAYFDLVNEVRDLYSKNLIAVNDEDVEILETDLGESAIYNDEVVYLDAPIESDDEITEAEHQGKQVKLNKPMRTPGGPKKFKVFVKSGDKVKLVRFGDSKSSGLSIKNNSPSRAKSFRARHKCSEKKDRTTPGYWSCNVARYAKSLGLKSDRPW